MVKNKGALLVRTASMDVVVGTCNGITLRVPLPTPLTVYRCVCSRESLPCTKLIEYPVFRVHSMANCPELALSGSSDHWQRGNTRTITTNCVLRLAARLEREITVSSTPKVAHARKRIPVDIIIFIRAHSPALNQGILESYWEDSENSAGKIRRGWAAGPYAGHGNRSGWQPSRASRLQAI